MDAVVYVWFICMVYIMRTPAVALMFSRDGSLLVVATQV
jgi:hypothetical protein